MAEVVSVYPHPGPQTWALQSAAKELLYGGEAGGGKSRFLCLDALRLVEHPSYKGILFRRHTTELADSLIPETEKIYPHLGARWQSAKLKWIFPSGASIRLAHMEHENTKNRYDGGEYQFCGFDELTHFYESQYLFMFSRLRSAEGLPTYMRATTNPGGMGHEWVLKRFAPWLYPETERAYKGVRAKAGQKLFFRRTPLGVDEVCDPKWHDPECKKCHPKKPCAEHKPRSRVFLPAKLTDNPSLGGEYAANLDSLDPITRAWKKFGDWMARPEGGKVFNRENLLPTERRPFMLDRPTQAVARVRFWDRAATDGGGDYTAGVLMSVMANGIFVVEDVIAKQLDPAGVATLIIQTAKSDPPGTIVGLEREPGASGKFEAAFYVRALAGFNVQVIPADANKVVRAGPFSTQVDGGNVRLVVGEWNDPYILELHSFPDGKHDDQVDGSSGAFRVLVPLLHAFRESGESISVMAL